MKLQCPLVQNSRVLVLPSAGDGETMKVSYFSRKRALVGIGMSTRIWALLGSGMFQESFFGLHISSILHVSLFFLVVINKTRKKLWHWNILNCSFKTALFIKQNNSEEFLIHDNNLCFLLLQNRSKCIYRACS